jgi:hypothetical protein
MVVVRFPFMEPDGPKQFTDLQSWLFMGTIFAATAVLVWLPVFIS